MDLNNITNMIKEYNPDAIIFDDLDEAIIGVGQQHGMNSVAIYDREKCIQIFADKFLKDSENEDDAYLSAIEWFEFNVECSYLGENTPIFVNLF